MDKQEFGKFVMALKTYYPRETLLPNNQAIELWYRQLNDIPYEIAELVLNKWVATNRWSPSIADIREQATEVKQGQKPDWGAGWEQVLSAIKNYGVYRPDEALASMDETTRQAVKQIGFREICMSENIAADRANFRMIYERQVERQKQDAQIPEKLKLMITRQQAGMIEKEGENDT